MPRITTPEADALLDVETPVLDKGFVRLVDYLGGDARVVSSARVSYGDGTRTVREDRGLINYLMRNAHTSPFEQVELVFHLKMPLFVVAQHIRHRMASVNAMSARYSVMKDEFYLPAPEQVRGQGTANKQVGDGQVEAFDAEMMSRATAENARCAYDLYQVAIENGIAREQARMMLPQNLYTELYWKIDLHNLFHYLRLRLDWHAQAEIRAYAEPMAACAKAVAPLCYEAFENHVLNGARLSSYEITAVKAMITGFEDGLTERQREELCMKLRMNEE